MGLVIILVSALGLLFCCFVFVSVVFISLWCLCIFAHIFSSSFHLLSLMVRVTWEQIGYMGRVEFSFVFSIVLVYPFLGVCSGSLSWLFHFFFVVGRAWGMPLVNLYNFIVFILWLIQKKVWNWVLKVWFDMWSKKICLIMSFGKSFQNLIQILITHNKTHYFHTIENSDKHL